MLLPNVDQVLCSGGFPDFFFEKGDFSHWKSEIALALGSPFANLNCKLRENDKNLCTCMQGLLEKHASQTKRL